MAFSMLLVCVCNHVKCVSMMVYVLMLASFSFKKNNPSMFMRFMMFFLNKWPKYHNYDFSFRKE